MESYATEIQKLKEQIREKEALIERMSGSIYYKPNLYINYNKAIFDKIKAEEQKKITLNSLNDYTNDKFEQRQRENLKKEAEVKARLDDLKRQQEDAARRHLDVITRAKEYKQDLDTQKHLKSCIIAEEINDIKSNLPKKEEAPIQRAAPSPIYNATHGTFTKKHPKTIFFNPITGELQDSSNFAHGNFKLPSAHRQSESLFLPQLKNNNRVAPEFSSLKAFQQPKFTKQYPKFVPSFPITGNGYGFQSMSGMQSQKIIKNIANF